MPWTPSEAVSDRLLVADRFGGGILMAGLPNHSRLEPSICHLNEDSALPIGPSFFRPAHTLVRILSIFLRSRHGAIIEGTSRRSHRLPEIDAGCMATGLRFGHLGPGRRALISAFAPHQETSIAPQRLLPAVR